MIARRAIRQSEPTCQPADPCNPEPNSNEDLQERRTLEQKPHHHADSKRRHDQQTWCRIRPASVEDGIHERGHANVQRQSREQAIDILAHHQSRRGNGARIAPIRFAATNQRDTHRSRGHADYAQHGHVQPRAMLRTAKLIQAHIRQNRVGRGEPATTKHWHEQQPPPRHFPKFKR